MQLRDNNTLGAIDDKRTIIGHQRNFTEIDLLLFNVLNRFVGRFLVVNHQPDSDPQRHRIGHAAELTLLDIKSGLTQDVVDVLKCCIACIANDREYRVESCMQAGILSITDSHTHLRKVFIRIELNCQQIG